jgi:carbon storage regulator CsrA
MLILGRKPGEQIVLGGTIHVIAVAICGNRVRLGISTPAEVSTLWEELDLTTDHPVGPVCSEKRTRPFSRG